LFLCLQCQGGVAGEDFSTDKYCEDAPHEHGHRDPAAECIAAQFVVHGWRETEIDALHPRDHSRPSALAAFDWHRHIDRAAIVHQAVRSQKRTTKYG
jgi:hypothetical protein